jgi:hypothetical protein
VYAVCEVSNIKLVNVDNFAFNPDAIDTIEGDQHGCKITFRSSKTQYFEKSLDWMKQNIAAQQTGVVR